MVSRDLAEQSGQFVPLALAQRRGHVGLVRRADLIARESLELVDHADAEVMPRPDRAK